MCLLHYLLFLSYFIPTLFLLYKLVLFHPTICLFCLSLSFVEEDMGSSACLVFFYFFSNFVFFLIHAFSTTVFVFFLHAFLGMFVISFSLAFLFFRQFLLLTLSVVPCFFSSCFFLLIFTPTLLYKRIWAFVGQIVFTGAKGIRPDWPYFAKAIPLRKQLSQLMKKKSWWNPNLRRWMNKVTSI